MIQFRVEGLGSAESDHICQNGGAVSDTGDTFGLPGDDAGPL